MPTVLFLLISIRLCALMLIGMTGSLLPIIPLTFPYIDKLVFSGLPRWVYSWGNFDGVHFVGIAMQGYHQFDQAFFPAYPMFIRALEVYTGSYVVSGLFISHVFGALAFFYVYLLTKDMYGEKIALWCVGFLMAMPVGFFIGALYTEALFLFLFCAGLYYIRRGYVWSPVLVGVLAGLTRIQGVLLSLAYIGFLFERVYRHQAVRSSVVLVLSPLIGLGSYMAYLHVTYNDWLYFLHAQEAFGAQRTSEFVSLPRVFVRYVRIFVTADLSWAYGIALLEVVVTLAALGACAWLIVKSLKEKHWGGIGIASMGIAMICMPAVTGTLSSMPRYALPVLSLPIACAHISSHALRWAALIVCIVVQIFLGLMFVQGRFVS